MTRKPFEAGIRLAAHNCKKKPADLIVPAHLAESRPSAEKLAARIIEYAKTGKLEKVYIDAENRIVDGYISYLISRLYNIPKLPCVKIAADASSLLPFLPKIDCGEFTLEVTASSPEETAHPGFTIWEHRPGQPRRQACFAEYNPESSRGKNLCIGVYTEQSDEPVHYFPYYSKM